MMGKKGTAILMAGIIAAGTLAGCGQTESSGEGTQLSLIHI